MITKGITHILVVQLILVVLILGSWGVNLSKLAACDFEPNYRCEIVHVVGLFPPAAVITAWMGDDGK